MFNVVLVYPDIPYNTGNIGRLCLGLDARLHLVKPLGFKINDKYLKRAGLDYWKDVNCVMHSSYDEFLSYSSGERLIFASTKAKISCYEYEYKKGDFLVFGSETKGLPEKIVYNNIDRAVKIPMCGKIRSLNLSNAVAVILYEAYRQNIFFKA